MISYFLGQIVSFNNWFHLLLRLLCFALFSLFNRFWRSVLFLNISEPLGRSVTSFLQPGSILNPYSPSFPKAIHIAINHHIHHRSISTLSVLYLRSIIRYKMCGFHPVEYLIPSLPPLHLLLLLGSISWALYPISISQHSIMEMRMNIS